MYLYRYIKYKRFEELLESSKLYFANPFSWPDKKEGFLYREIKSPGGLEKVAQIMREQGAEESLIQAWIGQLKSNTYPVRCQCWCQEKDSPQMWETYCKDHINDGVMIKTCPQRLGQLQYGGHIVEMISVQYKNSLSLEEEIADAFDIRHGICYFPRLFRMKRMEYAFEKEYRAYTILDGPIEDEEENGKGINVSIPDVSGFICAASVHPNASEAHISLVSELCERFGILFELDSLGKAGL